MTDPTPLFRLVSLLTLGLTSPVLLADHGAYLDEQDFLVDIPEVTSATRLPQKLTETPASVSVIDRKTIIASGARTIPDLMRLVPGFQSFHSSANKFATTYHGASDNFPRRLEVMIDGRSVYLPLLATVDWTSLGISLEDIERIEVVRGSNVPTQGSNAFMGSINIITHEPAQLSGGHISAQGGSMNTRDLHLGYSDHLDQWSYHLSGGHEENEGTDRYGDGLERNFLRFSASYTPSLTDTLWIQTGVDRGHTYVGQSDQLSSVFHKRDHDANYQSLKYLHLYSDTGSVQLQAHHNYLDLETPSIATEEVEAFLFDATGMPPSASLVSEFIRLNTPHEDSEHGTSHTYDTELQVTDRLGALQLVGGLGYRHESAASSMLLQSGKVTEDRWRLFSNLDWDFASRWSLSTGFMYEDSSEGSDAFSYRHALIYHPDKTKSLRLGYSISERLPSLLERYGNYTLYAPAALFGSVQAYDRDIQANPDLDPERIKTYELGYYQSFADQRGYIDLRLFHEQLSNMIDSYYLPAEELAGLQDPRHIQRVSTSMNSQGWENRGAEIQLQRQLNSQLSLLLNYTYTNTRTEPWTTNKKLDGTIKIFRDAITPEHTASMVLNWTPTPALNLSLMHYYMDSVHWLEGGHRDSYQRTDLRAARQWPVGNGATLEAALTLQNAFGPTYQEFYEHNPFDRRAWLQLTFRYH